MAEGCIDSGYQKFKTWRWDVFKENVWRNGFKVEDLPDKIQNEKNYDHFLRSITTEKAFDDFCTDYSDHMKSFPLGKVIAVLKVLAIIMMDYNRESNPDQDFEFVVRMHHIIHKYHVRLWLSELNLMHLVKKPETGK